MKKEQTTVDIDFAEAAVPKYARRGIVTMFMIMLGFTFFSASMWVGQELADGLDFGGFLISLIIGGLDFSGLNIGVFPIGDLIMSIINFLCISLVVFWMVKIINRFNRKKEKEPEPEAPAKPTTDELLADILAELKLQNGRAEAAKTLDAAEEEESSASER